MSTDLHHLAAAYALDALDADERRAFESHYPSCEVCASEVRDFRGVSEQLAVGVAESPAPRLKASIMNEISQTRQLSPIVSQQAQGTVSDLAARRAQRLRNLPLMMVAAAAIVVAIIGVGSLLGSNGAGNTELVIGAPDAVVYSLTGEQGSLQVVWSDGLDKAAVFGNGLPDPGQGKVYELWFLEADGPAPAGLFNSADGVVRTVLDLDDRAPAGWAITIEPAGGSPQPTGEILYATDA